MQGLPPERKAEYDQDRRWHVRYAVHGTAEIDAAGKRYPATPLQISLGGIHLKMDQSPPLDQVLNLKLDIYGFGELIQADIKVIRTDPKKVTAIFLAPEPCLARCIAWISSYDKPASK